MAIDLIAQIDNRFLAVFPHEISHRHHRLIATTNGINMFHASHLPEQPFERTRHLLFDFCGSARLLLGSLLIVRSILLSVACLKTT